MQRYRYVHVRSEASKVVSTREVIPQSKELAAIEAVLAFPPKTWKSYSNSLQDSVSIIRMEMNEFNAAWDKGDMVTAHAELLHVTAACARALRSIS